MFPSVSQIEEHSDRFSISTEEIGTRFALWKATDSSGISYFYHLANVPEALTKETRFVAPADFFVLGYDPVKKEMLEWDAEWTPLMPDGSEIQQ